MCVTTHTISDMFALENFCLELSLREPDIITGNSGTRSGSCNVWFDGRRMIQDRKIWWDVRLVYPTLLHSPNRF